MTTDHISIRVLICEDEPLIMMTSVDMLEEAGMTVFEAGTANGALAQLATNSVDVFVTDVGLPDMSGFDLAVEVRKAYPKLSIVFATGNQAVKGASELGNTAVLGKPYTEEELVSAVRKIAMQATSV